eukprot:SAG11_NODE_13391_length_657_cov_1.564516_2_plen_55_part_01
MKLMLQGFPSIFLLFESIQFASWWGGGGGGGGGGEGREREGGGGGGEGVQSLCVG